MPKATHDKKSDEKRKDGRRPLLVYLKPDIIKRLKVAALDRSTHAYLVAEEAIEKLLSETDRVSSD